MPENMSEERKKILTAFGGELIETPADESLTGCLAKIDELVQAGAVVVGPKPAGAFYLYADASGFTDDSLTFCEQLLESAGVAITPGHDFGRHRAAQHVRFAYTTGQERLELGVERLRRFITAGGD